MDNRPKASLHEPADSQQSSPAASRRNAGRVVLREFDGELLVSCPEPANRIVKRVHGHRWAGGPGREWGVPLASRDWLTRVLTEAGYDVRRQGRAPLPSSQRPTLPECSGELPDGTACRAPFRIGTMLPVTCSLCGTRLVEFSYYDPSA